MRREGGREGGREEREEEKEFALGWVGVSE